VQNTKWLSWILMLVLSIIWGSSFILMKKGLEVYSFDQLASFRIMLVWLVFMPFLVQKRAELRKLNFKYLLIFAIFSGFFPPFLFAKAQTVLNSSTAGILNSLSPLFTLLSGILLFRTVFRLHKLSGVLIGLGGAVILILFRNSGGIEITGDRFFYGLLIIIACVFYGLSSNILKEFLQEMHPVLIAAVAYFMIGPPMAVYLFTTDFIAVTTTDPGAPMAILYMSILAIVGTGMAMVLYSKLVQISNALFASSVTYLIPVVALGWGLMDGEPFGTLQLLSIATILGGIFIANKDVYLGKKVLVEG
jgi:drug/metabolite transporter (DMT)-like permease